LRILQTTPSRTKERWVKKKIGELGPKCKKRGWIVTAQGRKTTRDCSTQKRVLDCRGRDMTNWDGRRTKGSRKPMLRGSKQGQPHPQEGPKTTRNKREERSDLLWGKGQTTTNVEPFSP